MDNILFDADLYEAQIEQMNIEYECLQDIYDRFLRDVISKSDKIDDFKIKANEIKEELLKVQEEILSLKKRAELIKKHYLEVEEINLHMVKELPDAEVVIANGAYQGHGPVLSNRYRVVYDESAYVVNKNYDFEDWLVDWLNTGENR